MAIFRREYSVRRRSVRGGTDRVVLAQSSVARCRLTARERRGEMPGGAQGALCGLLCTVGNAGANAGGVQGAVVRSCLRMRPSILVRSGYLAEWPAYAGDRSRCDRCCVAALPRRRRDRDRESSGFHFFPGESCPDEVPSPVRRTRTVVEIFGYARGTVGPAPPERTHGACHGRRRVRVG